MINEIEEVNKQNNGINEPRKIDEFKNFNSNNEDFQNEIIIPSSKLNESKCLLILNLQRPFTNITLEGLLAKYGAVKRFWLDNIKTHCYVEVYFNFKIVFIYG